MFSFVFDHSWYILLKNEKHAKNMADFTVLGPAEGVRVLLNAGGLLSVTIGKLGLWATVRGVFKKWGREEILSISNGS